MRFFFMPWGIILQVIAIIHFSKRRPETYWLWIIILMGPLGALAYILVEMLPDLGLLEHSMGGFSRRKRIRALEALVLDNPSAGNYEELGDLLLEEKKYERARDAFDHALAQRTDALDPFYKRGLAALALGDAAAAVPDLEHVVKSDPKYDYRRSQLFYAVALAANDQSEPAAAAYKSLLESGGTIEALCHAAEFFAAQGRKAEARELLERIAIRKRTMPSYQKRRDRPFLRRASSLERKLPLTN
jgi:hypothetical protein